ncbi:MAG: P1 family peptidase [Chloroflexi bacterium]|nr:P1 family peptidase [Chloroflexota bacterium]
MEGMHNAITDVPGIKVGHFTDREHATGCTVVLCEGGAVGGVDVRGSSPGTRETDLLRPVNLVEQVNAVLLSGGSAFGLDAASGVMRYLEERGVGFRVGTAVVPIVPAAILFDLGLVTGEVRPGPAEGYQACQQASDGFLEEGSVGAGTGATVAKALGMARAVKGGIGTASVRVGEKLVVGAVVAVNAFGDIVDPDNGRLLAGPRRQEHGDFHNTTQLLLQGLAHIPSLLPVNTTIGVVACSGRLTKEQTTKLAVHAQDGLALAVRPAHCMGDGDVVFALATGQSDEPVVMDRLGAAAAVAVSRAIVNAVQAATGLGGIPSAREYLESRKKGLG